MRDHHADLTHWQAWSTTDGRHGPAETHAMTFSWRGLASGRDGAIAAAKRAVAAIWTIASIQGGSGPASPPEGLFGHWSALPSDHAASEWVISKDAMAALGPQRAPSRDERGEAMRREMTLAVAILGIGALEHVPHGPVSAYVCLNHPEKVNWHTLSARTQIAYKDIPHDPDAAEAMMALAIPAWLATEGSFTRILSECDYVPPDSATLRAYEPEALREPVAAKVAEAAGAIGKLGATETAERLRALMASTLKRISP